MATIIEMTRLHSYLIASFLFFWTVHEAASVSATSASLGGKHSVEDDDLTVQLVNPVGKIHGHIVKSQNGNDVYAFQDVPYAQPPIGANRFKPPQPLNDWEGVLETTSNRKICPQMRTVQSTVGNLEELTETEDCLVLNVYSPVKPDSGSSLPVYFWIHGGSFFENSGSINQFDPKFFLDRDILVVTTNYRLGALGFLTINNDVIPGNLGLKDQHLAIKWVAENIHLFGGDPSRIVLGGQGAGAVSVGYQLLSSSNEGLIKAAVQESGSSLNTFGFQIGFRDRAFEFGRRINASFNTNDDDELLQYLQAAPLSEVMRVQSEFRSNERIGFMDGEYWKPIVEDAAVPDALITAPMRESFESGNFNLVPILLGFTSEESLKFLAEVDDDAYNKAAAAFDSIPALLTSDKYNIGQKNKRLAGTEVKAVYTQATFAQNETAFVRFASDAAYTRGILRQAEAASSFVPVYLYQLSYDSGLSEDVPGTGHGLDLAYFWNTPSTPAPTITEANRNVLLKLWTNFIKEQNPTPQQDADLQNVIWEKTQPSTLRYLDINDVLSSGTTPRQYEEVKTILDKYLQRPFNVY